MRTLRIIYFEDYTKLQAKSRNIKLVNFESVLKLMTDTPKLVPLIPEFAKGLYKAAVASRYY